MIADDLPSAETKAVNRVPYAFAKSRGVIVASVDDGGIGVIVRRDSTATLALAEIRRVFGKPLKLTFVEPSVFEDRLEGLYSGQGADGGFSMMEDIGRDLKLQNLADDMPHITDLLEAGDEAPVIRFINVLISQALAEKASDIHIELFGTRSIVRFRVDGVLRDIIEPPRPLHSALVTRIKVIAGLDIAEKRLPQDGRITIGMGGRSVDVRVSILPTGHGERVVLRLLDKRSGVLDLGQLGMGGTDMQMTDSLIRRPHGIFLVTGPTGSGKTTTLYAILSRLDLRKLNVLTVEDPVEYDLDGINQTQANAAIGMSFARALRSILRQDPDVIMIGEIRDLETAQIAVQASLTGHLVFATLHTNDSVGAVTRLMDMGVEPFLLASSLLGVMAQRLVRRLCPDCAEKHMADAKERRIMGNGAEFIYTAVGCPKCKNTGYQGRSGVFEIFSVDDNVRKLIHDQAGEHEIRRHISEEMGAVNLRQAAMKLVAAGATSLEEALRVTGDSSEGLADL
ncbi:MAG: type II secretion system ATPase GspE [Nitrospinae bacterium]|nr:type II secretion system ATPase GspE [Nitrospinota bacterium]